MRTQSLAFLACIAYAGSLSAADKVSPGRAVDVDVHLSSKFFNPSTGQTIGIRLNVQQAQTVVVEILDRDRRVVRRFPKRAVKAGFFEQKWDGRDDAGTVVPDEAYSPRIIVTGAAGAQTYDPSKDVSPAWDLKPVRTYSAVDGVLAYTLARDARVVVQAGLATVDPVTKKAGLPVVLKTIVNREPRVAGRVLERWNGLDESGLIVVRDLPGFAFAIAAEAFPENTMLTVGNRTQSFVDYARSRATNHDVKVTAAIPAILDALDDRVPELSLTSNAAWNPERAGWETRGPLTVTARINRAGRFLDQPTALYLFVDERQVAEQEHPESPVALSVDTNALPPGEHRVVVNWTNRKGLTAVNCLKLLVPSLRAASGAK